jgi:4-hydroxy-tetrahydrodipicolinate reductase
MEKVKVIVFGVGDVGKEVTKCLVTKKNVEIVGALDRGPCVGKDLGDVAGLGKKLGVLISKDGDDLFSSIESNVVIHSTSTSVGDTYKQLVTPITKRVNVITAAEEMSNPYVYDFSSAAKLDSLAKEHGVAVLGTGLWPTWLDMELPLVLSGGCREVRSIKYNRRSDLRPYIGSIVAKKFGLGVKRQEFEEGLRNGSIVGHVGFEGTFEKLAYYFGWEIEEIKKYNEADYDEKGYSVTLRTGAKAIVNGETKIEMEIYGSTDMKWETSDTIFIDAIPPIHMVIKPSVVGTVPVANVLVNQIPRVMNSQPGIITEPAVGLFSFGGKVGSYLR